MLADVRHGLLTPAPMPDEPGVPFVAEPQCAGRWELFDSLDPIDHAEARLICLDCPVIGWCRGQLAAALEASPAVTGTWAANLVGTPNTPVLGDCRTCERPMVVRERRVGAAPPGDFVYFAANGLCTACYGRRRYQENARG